MCVRSQRKRVDFKMKRRREAAEEGADEGGAEAGGGEGGGGGGGAGGGSFCRLRMDIVHLNLGRVEGVRGREVVVTGKHLCGGATGLDKEASVLT